MKHNWIGQVIVICLMLALGFTLFWFAFEPRPNEFSATGTSATGTMRSGAVSGDPANRTWYWLRDDARGVTCYAASGHGIACLRDGAMHPERP